MFAGLLAIASLVVYATAQQQQPHHHHHSSTNRHLSHPQAVAVQAKHGDKHVDYYAYPKYTFKYGVEDGRTHDIKSQHETRDGDKVLGEYTIREADGTTRTVKYVADKHDGFHAEVIRSGHATHPAIYGRY